MINLDKKTIIFDFGNVLINLDFELCFQNFEHTLNVDWSERRLPQDLKDVIYHYDKGTIGKKEFIQPFLKLNDKANSEDVIFAWNSLLREIPKDVFGFLEDLSSHFNLVLLSNINDLHLDCVHKYLKDDYGIDDFESKYFDAVFYSNKIGKRKPEDDLYEHVTESLGVDPKDILFIDDLKENVKGAKKHDWNAVVHKGTDHIVTMMPVYLRMVNFKMK